MSYPVLMIEHWQLPECPQVRAKPCGKDDALNRLMSSVFPDHTITRHLMEHVFVPNLPRVQRTPIGPAIEHRSTLVVEPFRLL